MLARKLSDSQKHGHQPMASARQLVFDMGRLFAEVVPLDESMTFKLPQMLYQDFLRDTWHFSQELRTAYGRLGEEPEKNGQFPSTTQYPQDLAHMGDGPVRAKTCCPVYCFHRHV